VLLVMPDDAYPGGIPVLDLVVELEAEPELVAEVEAKPKFVAEPEFEAEPRELLTDPELVLVEPQR
jgi:hypothetical protein